MKLCNMRNTLHANLSPGSNRCEQGLQSLAEQLPEALHELWFRWHAVVPGDTSGAAPGAVTASAAADSALEQPGTAARSCLLAGLTGAGGDAIAVDVSAWPARVLQLRLAARHAARWAPNLIADALLPHSNPC